MLPLQGTMPTVPPLAVRVRGYGRLGYGIALGLILLGLAAMVVPTIVGADMMNGGYAIGLIGFMVALTGLIALPFLWQRSRVLQRMVRGEDVLVYWTYAPADWARYTETEYHEESAEKRQLLLLVTVIAVAIFGACALFDAETRGFMLGVLAVLLVVLTTVAVLVPWLNRQRNRRTTGEALIARSGIWIGGTLHTWRSVGTWLSGATWQPGDPPELAITYAALTRAGVQEYTVRVPIPPGHEAEAQWVLTALAPAVRGAG